jgi:hypothetical protein
MAVIREARNAQRKHLESMFRMFEHKSPRSVVYKVVNRAENITVVLVLAILQLQALLQGI